MDKLDSDFLKAALRDIGLALNACHNTVTSDSYDTAPDELSWRIDNSKEIEMVRKLERALLPNTGAIAKITVVVQAFRGCGEQPFGGRLTRRHRRGKVHLRQRSHYQVCRLLSYPHAFGRAWGLRPTRCRYLILRRCGSVPRRCG